MKKFVFVLFIAVILSCQTTKFEIDPIDSELNDKLLSLKELDTRLFSSKIRFQYFQLKQPAKIEPADVTKNIIDYVEKKYTVAETEKTDELNLLFYKNTATTREIYEAARDTDNGLLDSDQHQLLARVGFTKFPDGTFIRRTLVYTKGSSAFEQLDTLRRSRIKINEKPIAETLPLTSIAVVTNNSCLTVKSNVKEQSFNDCYETDFVRVKTANESKISLTFINGKSAMDIEFFPNGEDWLSKKVTFFGQTSNAKDGITKKLEVSLKNFNYSAIAESFEPN